MAIIPIGAAAAVTNHSTVTSRMPWYHILKWQPFRIDALGLVTLLGADEINRLVGRLVKSRYTEYMPLLGAFMFASNQFTDAYSGHNLYNLTAAIQTTDLAGWFQRWCLNQPFPKGGAAVEWVVKDSPARSPSKTLVAFVISFITNGMLVAFTITQGDWWGLGNALSMVISIGVRTSLVRENRRALDDAALVAKAKSGTEEAKFLVVLADSTAIKMTAPKELIKLCFIEKPKVRNPNLYLIVRILGWIGFGVHIISIGMSGLATQIITVFIMVVASVLTAFRIGCDENYVGCYIYANTRCSPTIDDRRWLSEQNRKDDGLGKRRDIYVELDLSRTEEISMVDWNLFPHRFNEVWWKDYYEKVAERDWERLDRLHPEIKAKMTPQTTSQDLLQAQTQWRELEHPELTSWEDVFQKNLLTTAGAGPGSNTNQGAGTGVATTPTGIIAPHSPNPPGLQPAGESSMAQVPHAPPLMTKTYNPNGFNVPNKTHICSSVHTVSSGGSSNPNNDRI